MSHRSRPFVAPMTDDELDAHLLTLGWRVMARMPSDPTAMTPEVAAAMLPGFDTAMRQFGHLFQPDTEGEKRPA